MISTEGSKPNVLREKSYSFAVQIVLFCKELPSEYQYSLNNQLLRSGTSIGANVEEANGAYSKNDFRAKLGIAYKEARETRYWLNLIRDAKIYHGNRIKNLLTEVDEIIRILIAILKSSQQLNP